MRLVKPAFDVGITIGAADPAAMLAFYRERVGLAEDHALPLGGGRLQARHHWGDSIVKLNHRRGGEAPGVPTGLGPVTFLDPGFSATQQLVDPEGNGVQLMNGDVRRLELELRVTDPAASARFFEALGLPVQGDRVAVGASGLRLVQAASPEAPGGLDGTGIRYLTFQVDRADAAHAEALGAGAREGMAPRTLGEVARISFVIEPGGHWIELSQRASLTGSLTP
ncbi:MAG: VOC family protein [Pseudomonadales bacterium]|nr:VOC family protein [Pseudomonadales bacterium]